MKRTVSIVAICLAMAGALSLGRADEPEKEKSQHGEPSFWMKKKLQYSEEILAGLASEDFEQIRSAAKAMNALSQVEKWTHLARPDYRTLLSIFRDANETLIIEAEDEDLDGATLAYMQLTLSCVNCHKIVRHPTAAKAKPTAPKPD